MPELPEVTVVVNGLGQLVVGQQVNRLEVLSPIAGRLMPMPPRRFYWGPGWSVLGVGGKVAIIDLDSDYSLLVHLKMTGQLVYLPTDRPENQVGFGHPSPSLVGELPDKTTRVVFGLDAGQLFSTTAASLAGSACCRRWRSTLQSRWSI